MISDEDRAFARKRGKLTLQKGEIFFLRQLVEAIAPIVPITFRNKSLDDIYLRTAFVLLAAIELLFAQYALNIHNQANPARVLGMAAANNYLENACFHNSKQYQ